VSPQLIQAMESGLKLTLEVVDSSILTIALPLDQFAMARKAPPTQVFEFLNDDE
jgi:hypothetical protein